MKTGKKCWTALSVITSTLLVIVLALTSTAYSYEALINRTLGTVNYRVVDNGSESENTQYYTAKCTDGQQIHDWSADLSERLEAEGLVLLSNQGALPLDTQKPLKVSLFATGSVNINNSVQGMRGGVGGAADNSTSLLTLREALEERKAGGQPVEVNPVLWDFYTTGAGKSYGGQKRLNPETNVQTYYINEVPWSLYDATVKASFGDYGDAAIVVLSRDDTEGADLNVFGSDGENGNYLALSKEERELMQELTRLKANGTFQTLIVLLNGANPLQLDFLKDEKIAVDACLWIGNTGMTGIRAVAKALTGEVVPSGRLTDTFVYDNLSSPAMAAWALNQNGQFSAQYDTKTLNNTQKAYGVYSEGIYVGYRYYETRYADAVEGRSGTGPYRYAETVAYPFGSGLSYTSFAYSDWRVQETENGYDVSLTVTNMGDTFAGKETVQVYLQKPYTEYAIANGMEVAAAELIGFAKTDELAPGASQRLTITVEKQNFTSYDTYGLGSYLLDAGTYYLAAGRDAHDALNNILAAKGYTVADGMDADGDAALCTAIEVLDQDCVTYTVSTETGAKIENRLADADVNRSVGAGENLVTYVSRSNWIGTWPKEAIQLALTEMFAQELQSDREPDTQGEMPTMGVDSGLTLIALRGKDYDAPEWDTLLNQMSFEDMNTLLTTAYCTTAQISSVSKPQTNEQDGPTYCKEGKTDSRFPCEGVWAASFNTALLTEVGEALANDSLYVDYNGMWIPGINIHRTPYGGRAHEYFSEDPYLTGMMAVAEINGIQRYGVIAYPKHFAFNDQEANRNGIAIWLNEQAAREIYLRPWRYACSPMYGNAHGVMSSFNRVGNLWTSGSDALVNGILRGEFGFNGMIVTDMADANGTVYMSCVDGIMAGTDLWLSSGKDHSFAAYRQNATVVRAMREACKRVLYNVSNYSAVMNGYSANTQIVRVYTWWEIALLSTLGALGVLTLLSVGMLAKAYRKKK